MANTTQGYPCNWIKYILFQHGAEIGVYDNRQDAVDYGWSLIGYKHGLSPQTGYDFEQFTIRPRLVIPC